MGNPICDPRRSNDCQRALAEQFHLLRTLEPPLSPPPSNEVESACHATFILPQTGEQLVHLGIKRTYPHHPSQICKPGKGTKSIDFIRSTGPLIVMAGVSMFGNGDDDIWIGSFFSHGSEAGFVFASLTPIQARNQEEANRLCPAYSPLRKVTTMFSRDGDWSEAFEAVGEVTTAMHPAIPEPSAMNFPYVDRESRYWGACERGEVEVETVVVGDVPTHPPSETPDSTKECEPGAFWQAFDYEYRPMVALDGSEEGLPSDTPYLCVRALESEPTALLQGAISVADLRQKKGVILAHDALNPRNVTQIWAPNSNQISRIHGNSLFTIYLRWQEAAQNGQE